jgi:hypothetical protein
MIDQKDQLVPEQELTQTFIKFTRTDDGKRSRMVWDGKSELPYPYHTYEGMISNCREVNYE